MENYRGGLRNREKWDAYERAVDEMIQKTSTVYAPWHILESVDKKYARIRALKIVIEELKKCCKYAGLKSRYIYDKIGRMDRGSRHGKEEMIIEME